jgi:hypothetical protein
MGAIWVQSSVIAPTVIKGFGNRDRKNQTELVPRHMHLVRLRADCGGGG